MVELELFDGAQDESLFGGQRVPSAALERRTGRRRASTEESGERMVERLGEDHANARRLAEGLAKLPGLRVDLSSVQTNIVILRVDRGPAATDELVRGCAARKVKVHAMGPAAIRCVTHKDVDGDDITRALDAFRELTSRW